jgi:acyl-CoA reductase-like NAD-dependent aldehyde dehydrogenase
MEGPGTIIDVVARVAMERKAMREVRFLIDRWGESDRSVLVLDSDRLARDPTLALAGQVRDVSILRRVLLRSSRGTLIPKTPEERFAAAYRRSVGTFEVTRARLEEAAFARCYLPDLLMVGRALEHGARQAERLRSLSIDRRRELLLEVAEELQKREDELISVATVEGRTRKGIEWDLQVIREVLRVDNLDTLASELEPVTHRDGCRVVRDPLGIVGVGVPHFAGPAREVQLLATSFLAGNFTFLAMPLRAGVSTMLIAEIMDGVLREREVEALSAMIPEDPRALLGILAESPRVRGLVLFGAGKGQRAANLEASDRDKAVLHAGEGGASAIVWDGADILAAAADIVRARFTDTGRLPVAVRRVYVHPAVHDELVQALESELRSLMVGLTSDPSTDVGPVGFLGVLEHLQQVVEEARRLGATVVHGGERIDWRGEADPLGLFFQPTLVDNCTQGMRITNEHLIGPVLPVCEESDLQRATKLARTGPPVEAVSVWVASTADSDQFIEALMVPGLLLGGGHLRASPPTIGLSDQWGPVELMHRLSFMRWIRPPL